MKQTQDIYREHEAKVIECNDLGDGVPVGTEDHFLALLKLIKEVELPDKDTVLKNLRILYAACEEHSKADYRGIDAHKWAFIASHAEHLLHGYSAMLYMLIAKEHM